MDVSIVIPTYNEIENIDDFVKNLFSVLGSTGLNAEAIIVDDNSPDGTGAKAEELSQKFPLQVIHRPSKMGLGSAVVDGFKIAKGDVLGVMDADFCHPVEMVPSMITEIKKGGADFVIGSRHVGEDCTKNWPFIRRILSHSACLLSRLVTNVRDPVSGFFFIRKAVIDGVDLKTKRFKICLEVIVKGKHTKIKEIPYTFENRALGSSKLSFLELVGFVFQVFGLFAYKAVKRRK